MTFLYRIGYNRNQFRGDGSDCEELGAQGRQEAPIHNFYAILY
jgi:hypothetical protein